MERGIKVVMLKVAMQLDTQMRGPRDVAGVALLARHSWAIVS